MKRGTHLHWLASLAVLVAIMCSTSLARAQTATPVRETSTEAASSIIVGTGWDVLSFDGAATKGEFRYLIGEPSIRSRFPMVVQNTSTKSVSNLVFKVKAILPEEKQEEDSTAVDGEDDVWIYPLTIGPGEFGFGLISFFIPGTSLTAYIEDESTFQVKQLDSDERMEDLRDVAIIDADVSSSGQVTGVLFNGNKEDLHEIEIRMLCLEDSGIVTETDFDVLDRRLLAAEDSAEFETSLPDDCGDLFFLAAIAAVRN